jgi:hypothetical protein
MGQTRRKKACKTPPSTPKDASETPKTTNHDGTVAPSGRPWPRTKDPKGAPKTPLGHRGGRQNSAKQKLRAPLQKTQNIKKRQQKHTPNPIAIYEGFVRLPFGGPLLPFGGPFLETPRHEENTKTIILLQFWTPRGAKTLEHPVFYEGS